MLLLATADSNLDEDRFALERAIATLLSTPDDSNLDEDIAMLMTLGAKSKLFLSGAYFQ